MKRLFLAIGLIAAATFTAHAWTPLLLDSPGFTAFVLSDRFWPSVFGVVLGLSFLCAASCAALIFHPGPLAGRAQEPEDRT